MELNWMNAEIWQEKANLEKEDYDPAWSWDCGFKLDFDGSLVRVSSRFYPPHKNSSGIWEGKVTIRLLDEILIEKELKNSDLNYLKTETENFVNDYKSALKLAIKTIKQ